MLSLIAGKVGAGKTKKLVEIANKDAENCKGSIIFIERGNELKFDLSHNIRLVDINKYSIHDFDVLYGFICGICSDNYDISEIFVDTVLSVGSENLHEFEVFVGMIKDISEKRNIKIYMSVTIEFKHLPSFISREIQKN